MAAAAALLAASALGLRAWVSWVKAPGPGPAPAPAHVRAIDPGDLTEALADATSATWDLAREASAPAARVGRQVLDDAAAIPGTPSALAMPVAVAPAPEVWQTVGDRLSAGVRPLSGTARRAFSFLLGPPPDGDGRGAPPRPPHGA